MRTAFFRILLITLGLAVWVVPAASAAPGPGVNIGVAPSKLQLRLVPGRTAHTTIRVYNKGDDPVVLDVYPQDYAIDSRSNVTFKTAGSLPGSAAAWTELSRKLLHVPAHASRALGVTVRVPQGVPPGTHTLAVIFRSRTTTTGSGGVRYQPAVASLLAAGVTAADGSGLVMRGAAVVRSVHVHWPSLLSVRSPGDLWDALFTPTVTAEVAVVNRGNTFFNILHGTTSFEPGTSVGGSSTDVKAPHYTILPGSVRYLQVAWTSAPFIGWTQLQDPPLLQRHLGPQLHLPGQRADHPLEPADPAGVAGRGDRGVAAAAAGHVAAGAPPPPAVGGAGLS